jgi:hypothetical protein
MADDPTNDEAIALHALGWTLGDERRADRFLALTGMTPDTLRATLSEPATLAAALRFLEAHEPDLVACAAAIGVAPGDLPETRRRFEA